MNKKIKVVRKECNCKECILNIKCPDYDKENPITKCKDFRNVKKNIALKLAPGDTVWLTRWYNTPIGEIVSRKIIYVSYNGEQVTYHCKDGAFDAAGFGDYAFQTLEAAKVISGMKGGTING